MIDSNAYEFDNTRIQFNEKNKTIGFNHSYEDAEKPVLTLQYNKNEHKSTLNEDSNENSANESKMTARSFINQNYQEEVKGDDWTVEQDTIKTSGNTSTLSLYEYSYSNSYNYPRADGIKATNKADHKTEYKDVVETEYLKYINLGLVKREEVDISQETDVYSVKTTINGEEMMYGYNKNTADSTKYDTDDPSYSHSNDYYLGKELRKAYNLDLYTTDYNYRTGENEYYNNTDNPDNKIQEYKTSEDYLEDEQLKPNDKLEESKKETLKKVNTNSSELNTEVTYRIKITNNQIETDEKHMPDKVDIPVETAINELAIYYDKNFIEAQEVSGDDGQKNQTRIVTKQKDGENGLLTDENHAATRVYYYKENEEKKQLNISHESLYGNHLPQNYADENDENNYRVMYLTGMEDLYLKEDEYVYVEITLTVDKDSDRNLLITEDEDMGLELISKIAAYTTRYEPDDGYYHHGLSGKYAALVDRDSHPGNLGLGNDNVTSHIAENGEVTYVETACEYYDNYEDDTYKVGIKVGLLDDPTPTPPPERKSSTERIIKGMVFEDARSETRSQKDEDGNETNEAVQYLGNGIYNKYIEESNSGDKNNENALTNSKVGEGDKSVEGVEVSLIEVVQTIQADENGQAKYYEYPARYTYDVYDENGTRIHKKGELIKTKTDEEGKYQLDHFVPGYYKVRFDYGYDEKSESSIIYNGQDYKSTTYYNELQGENQNESTKKLLYYTSDGAYQTDNIGSSKNFDYFDNVKKTLLVPNRSDAQDDEIRRLNVNSYSETMTALQAVIFSDPHRKDENGNSKGNEKRLTKNTHMYAETAIFYVKPEEVEKSQDTHIEPLTYKKDDSRSFDEKRLWRIDNLDFGLEYRPEASILLDKEISTLELVTSDNKTLIKLYFEGEIGNRKINESKSIGYENVQFLPNEGKTQQGFVYINMDTNILEGCTIKVEYEMTATNNSEVDRINKNLDEIKYEKGANDKNYGIFKVYTTHQKDENKIEYTYNANQTASELLAHKYYTSYDKTKNEYQLGYEYDASKGTEKYNYLNYLKKPYKVDDTTTIDNVTLKGQEYYGMYLGQTYYTGVKGNDVVAQLKVDHILDYVDNDFTFALSENNIKNRLWSSTTSEELQKNNLIDWDNVHKIKEGENNYLIDRKGIRYDTDNKTNLALSVDDNKKGNLEDNRKKGNITLSRFLETVFENRDAKNTYGQISAVATKVISADDVSLGKGLAYENISEVIQFTNITGRRTTLPKKDVDNKIEGGGVIGNANVENWAGANKYEDDTDATEIITISPPTGLTK